GRRAVKIAGDASYAAPHVLADGTRVTVRAIRPADRDELRRAFERLSATSRRRRFLVAPAELGDAQLAYLTDVDLVDHVALGDAGAVVRSQEGDTLELEVPLDDPSRASGDAEHPLRRILRTLVSFWSLLAHSESGRT